MDKKQLAIVTVAEAICKGDKIRANALIVHSEKLVTTLDGRSFDEICKFILLDPFYNNELERIFVSGIIGQLIGQLIGRGFMRAQ